MGLIFASMHGLVSQEKASGSSPVAWTPRALGSSLFLWHDYANAANTIDKTSTPTYQQFTGIVDKGPNGHNGMGLSYANANGSSYSAPFSNVNSTMQAMNGRQAASFRNSQEIYQSGGTSSVAYYGGTNLISIAMILTLNSGCKANGRVFSGKTASGSNEYNTAGTFAIVRGSNYNNGLSVCINFVGNYNVYVPIPAYDTPFILIMTADGTNINLSVNGGVSKSTSAVSTTFAMNKLSWGYSANASGENWYGLLGEAFIYQGLLTADQISKSEGWLASNWSAQSVLPSTHPYKTAAPTAEANDNYARRNSGLWVPSRLAA